MQLEEAVFYFRGVSVELLVHRRLQMLLMPVYHSETFISSEAKQADVTKSVQVAENTLRFQVMYCFQD